jgi:hypothetical protein
MEEGRFPTLHQVVSGEIVLCGPHDFYLHQSKVEIQCDYSPYNTLIYLSYDPIEEKEDS